MPLFFPCMSAYFLKSDKFRKKVGRVQNLLELETMKQTPSSVVTLNFH